MILHIKGMRENDRIVLKKVFFVPQFKTKIISVKRLTKNGFNVSFSKDQCKMTMPRQGGVIVIPNDKAGLHHLEAWIVKDKPRTQEVTVMNAS